MYGSTVRIHCTDPYAAVTHGPRRKMPNSTGSKGGRRIKDQGRGRQNWKQNMGVAVCTVQYSTLHYRPLRSLDFLSPTRLKLADIRKCGSLNNNSFVSPIMCEGAFRHTLPSFVGLLSQTVTSVGRSPDSQVINAPQDSSFEAQDMARIPQHIDPGTGHERLDSSCTRFILLTLHTIGYLGTF